MIDQFYENFKVRDYMDDKTLKEIFSENILDCSLGTNDFINNEFIKSYIEKSNYEINKYPSIEYDLLKDELIKYWQNNSNVFLKRENISFGGGVMGIIRNISEFLINEKTNILDCAPQFPRFISEIELKRANYNYYDMSNEENFKFNVNSLLNMISPKCDLIHIDNPNNPTGQIIKIDDIKRIIKEAQRYNIFVVIDEAYGDYMTDNNSAIKLVTEFDNVAVIRSASKFYGLPNHRVGCLFASEKFIKIYNKITIPFQFSDLSANVFRNIIKDYRKLQYIKEEIKEIKKGILDELKPDNYLYTNIETPIFTIKTNKYENLSAELRRNGIIVENCCTFLNLDNRYARIRIPREWKKLLEVLVNIV